MNEAIVRRKPGRNEVSRVPLQASVRPELFERLKRLSDRRDCPQSYIIREALEKFLDEVGV